jgi:hypothetical protein
MKKLISLALTLALVLGSFSAAFAAQVQGINVDGATKIDAVKAVINLGIIEGDDAGKFNASNLVNRAEFAAMVVRALGIPDSALNEFTTSGFNDIVGYSWAANYLGYTNRAGILKGDGNGNAMPGRTISPNEAVTIVLRSIGYTDNAAVLTGIWPANYVQLAQDSGLYKDVDSSSEVTRDNAAQIIYNALTVQKVQVAVNGEVSYLWETAPTTSRDGVPLNLLNAGLGGKEQSDRIITVADADDAVVNIRDLVGAYGTVYKDSKTDKVIAVGDIDTVFLTGNLKTPVSGGAISSSTFESDEDYTLSTYAKNQLIDVVTDITNGAFYVKPVNVNEISGEFFYNGENADTTNRKTIQSELKLPDSKFTIAADLSGKTINAIYSIARWDYDNGFLFTSGLLESNNLNGSDFVLNDDKAISLTSFSLNGVDELSDITTDNVVYVYTNSNHKITKVEVGTATVTGRVTDVDDDEYTIDGKVYKIAKDGPTVKVGDTGTARLDYAGDIYTWSVTNGTSGNYAILTGQVQPDSRDNITAVLFTKDGESIDRTLTNSLKETDSGLEGFIPQNALVDYAINSSGLLNGLNDLSGSVRTSSSGRLSEDYKVYAGTRVSDRAVVFTYDTGSGYSSALDDSFDDWDIAKVTDLDTSKDGFPAAYYTNSDGEIAVFIVSLDDVFAKDTVYAVINKVGTTVNANDDNVLRLTGLASGSALSIITDTNRSDPSAPIFDNRKAALYALTVKNDIVTDLAEVLTGIVDEDDKTLESVAEVMQVNEGSLSVKGNTFTVSGTRYDVSGSYTLEGEVYSLGANAAIYYYDSDDGNWLKKSLSSLQGLGAGTITLYKTDKDLATWDVVIAY